MADEVARIDENHHKTTLVLDENDNIRNLKTLRGVFYGWVWFREFC